MLQASEVEELLQGVSVIRGSSSCTSSDQRIGAVVRLRHMTSQERQSIGVSETEYTVWSDMCDHLVARRASFSRSPAEAVAMR